MVRKWKQKSIAPGCIKDIEWLNHFKEVYGEYEEKEEEIFEENRSCEIGDLDKDISRFEVLRAIRDMKKVERQEWMAFQLMFLKS